MISISGKVCIITGASSGIGKAISYALAAEQGHLYLLGRKKEKLLKLAEELRPRASSITIATLDLRKMDEIDAFARNFRERETKLDILINCGADYEMGEVSQSDAEIYNRLFETNVRGPMSLTQKLLPCFTSRPGQIVCINSSSGVKTNVNAGIFSASKHAFRVLTDSLRAEVNTKDIRVLSIYPGRTNTPLIQKIFKQENKSYDPQKLLQPEDIAATIIHSLKMPLTAEITDIHIRPFIKSY